MPNTAVRRTILYFSYWNNIYLRDVKYHMKMIMMMIETTTMLLLLMVLMMVLLLLMLLMLMMIMFNITTAI
ncbi:hypothetical protein DPMN_103249 [Dreissena polymorpha]|uniref:Uncharacterized protein n=1 Tax=Dreissena polymorpha TaxID=45954 RepID=A0A9D4K0M1_DREPO|nr:hypothetical protein DPMN_103249 [Dreissena polymorpha]